MGSRASLTAGTALAVLVGWACWSAGAAASTPDERASAFQPAAECSSAPANPVVDEGVSQVVTVTVPRVALIDSTGRVLNARTNTGEHPHTDDLIYVRVRSGYEVADSELVARIAAAEWQAVGTPGECRPTHWLGRTAPVSSD